MTTDTKLLQVIDRGMFRVGLLLLMAFALAHVHRLIMFQAEMATFDAKQLESAREAGQRIEPAGAVSRDKDQYYVRRVDNPPSPPRRTKSYVAHPGTSAEPLAVLRIPALHLEVPVLEGTDQFTLNRGVGRISGTSLPGEDGNIGIAGHRDGFFRSLKDIGMGNAIQLVTRSGTDVYLVDRIRITSPGDVTVLQPRTNRSLTLVTCYPFYFVGPAPSRYIVEASLKQ